MEHGTFMVGEDLKGKWVQSAAEKQDFSKGRGEWIVGLVNRVGVLSADDLAAIIGYAATPQGVQNAHRLLQRFKEAGRIQLFTQHGVHYGVDLDISLRTTK